ncbi:5744_t:CDS:1, partial [Cetraspora pellucida]
PCSQHCQATTEKVLAFDLYKEILKMQIDTAAFQSTTAGNSSSFMPSVDQQTRRII